MKAFVQAAFGVLLVCSYQDVSCQDTTIVHRQITWHSEHNIDLHSETGIDAICQIVTHADSTIDMDWGGINTFSIVGIDGTWSDPETNGNLLYHVLYQDKRGEITLQKSAGETIIIIDLTLDYAQGMKEKFIISHYE